MAGESESRKRWKNPKGFGVVFVRDGWLWTCVRRVRKTTHLRYPESGTVEIKKAVAAAMRICQEREAGGPRLITGTTTARTITGKSLCTVIEEFTRLHVPPTLPGDTQSAFRQAISHFLLGPADKNIPFEFEALRDRICERVANYSGAPSTRKKLWYKLGEIVQYGIDCGYIDRDPRAAAKVKNRGHEYEELDIDDDVPIYTEQEIADQIDWLQRNGHPRLAEYVQFAYLLGNRPIEPLRAMAEHWNGKALLIKGKKVKGNKTGERWLPLIDSEGVEPRPEAVALLTKLIENSRAYNGYLFPWRTLAAIQRTHADCRKALGIHDGRTLKTLRPTANWFYREVLRWPKEFRLEWLGHTDRVNRKHYDRRRTAEEVVALADDLRLAPQRPDSRSVRKVYERAGVGK